MQRYLKLQLLPSLLAAAASHAYIATPPSVFQDAGNTFYLSLGGGAGRQSAGDWGGTANHAGLNTPQENKPWVGLGTAALGYGFKNYPFRVEAAYNFVGPGKFEWDNLLPPVIIGQTASAEAKIYSHVGLLNVYGDLPLGEHWIPFLKLGAGYGINEAKFAYTNKANGHTYTSSSQRKNNFVWNAGVGINYAFSANLSLGTEFTYLNLGKAHVDALIPATDTTPEFEESFAKLDKLTTMAATVNLAYHF